MSAFKQKLARLGATAGVLAVSTAALMAVGGVTAGAASASEPECVAGSGTLQAQGSTLQKVAQTELWTTKWNSTCPSGSDFNFNYTGTGSGAALKAFGFTGGAAPEITDAFVGSDEAPTAPELEVAESSAGAPPVVVPVAQTSIAVIANKPAACVITGGITYADLNKLFNGEITKWSEISTMSAANKTACATAEGSENITRVVREDGSGTTYQFKNYLSELETASGIKAAAPGSIEVGGKCVAEMENPVTEEVEANTWAELRPNATLNLVWPNSTCNPGRTAIEKASGGGGVVAFVAGHSNTIGYAAYSDVFTGKATALAQPLQNKNSAVKTFGKAGTPGNEAKANCGERTYEVPSGAFSNGGLGVDWSEVFGAVPTISGTSYPLCTLTFDMGWNGYEAVGYGTNVGKAVHNYFQYELGAGKTALNEHGYSELPETTDPTTNVEGAAKVALGSVIN